MNGIGGREVLFKLCAMDELNFQYFFYYSFFACCVVYLIGLEMWSFSLNISVTFDSFYMSYIPLKYLYIAEANVRCVYSKW